MNVTRSGVVAVLFFAALFFIIGWGAPVGYAAYAPSDHFIEVNEFEASGAAVDASIHYACLDRTVYRGSAGSVITELYRLNGDGPPTEVYSAREERYFQEGRYQVLVRADLPERIGEGEYRYQRVYAMDLANGRVLRFFSFTSSTFNITDANGTIDSAPLC